MKELNIIFAKELNRLKCFQINNYDDLWYREHYSITNYDNNGIINHNNFFFSLTYGLPDSFPYIEW